MKNRQHNGQKKKYKRTNNDVQNITHKTKDRVTRIPLKTGSELSCPGGISSSCSTSVTSRVNIVANPGSVYDTWHISVDICCTDIPLRSTNVRLIKPGHCFPWTKYYSCSKKIKQSRIIHKHKKAEWESIR